MSDRISQNPTVAELTRMVDLAKIAAPLLRVFGVKGEVIDGFTNITGMADILELPDRFNAAFIGRGWIACETLSTDAMRAALELHAAGEHEKADAVLADTFDEEALERLFFRSERFHRTPGRGAQLAEAAKLYFEGRYLAALPLILIATDGVSYDVAGFGVFTEAADLTSFDTIVGHPTGLPALLASVRASRGKTNNDPLMFPYRNGILHGRDLGYGDRITCAKAWLLYQALIDWAGSKEDEERRKAEYAERQETTLADSLARYAKTKETRRQLDAWQPRILSAPPAAPFEEGSPEEALNEFLDGWRDRNFMKMGDYSPNYVGKTRGKMAHEMRSIAERVSLTDFRVVEFADISAGQARATVELTCATPEGPRVISNHATIALDPGSGQVELRGPNARWNVQGGLICRTREQLENGTANE